MYIYIYAQKSADVSDLVISRNISLKIYNKYEPNSSM